MKPFSLPESFLLGTATASLQIEGGDRNNSWYRWVEEGHSKEGHCVVACDHWNKIAEDTALMKSLGHHTYRLSIEWSRIEPDRGRFDADAMAHYRDEIESLREAGIVPLVTLHHFSNPLWLEDSGGWLNPDTVALFERYASYVVEALGDLVVDWVTINEPNVYALSGHVMGNWPPGRTNLLEYFKVARSMTLAHIASYKRIHEIRKKMGHRDTMVGVANHLRVLEPKSGGFLERCLASLYDYLFNRMLVDAMAAGKMGLLMGRNPFGEGRYIDFFGVNYYSREMISLSPDPAMLFGKMSTREGADVNDLGWEVYPEGLHAFCKGYWDRFQVPIYVTENGTCDARDAFRTRYIYDHLHQIRRLLDDGVDVRRYYHWTFVDNFEWEAGMSAKFGIVELDYETQERKVRPSGLFYRDICRNRGVTQAMIDEYLT